MLTSEDGTQYIMTWENGAPRYDKITYDPNGAVVTQWEHVNFYEMILRRFRNEID